MLDQKIATVILGLIVYTICLFVAIIVQCSGYSNLFDSVELEGNDVEC